MVAPVKGRAGLGVFFIKTGAEVSLAGSTGNMLLLYVFLTSDVEGQERVAVPVKVAMF